MQGAAPHMIPVTVIVTTKNEAARIADCLQALKDFDEVIVVDSASRDATAQIAMDRGATVINFVWNGQYPKKRQWCLENVPCRHDWIFFVDVDEIVTPELIEEMRNVFSQPPENAGFFITGHYRVDGRILLHGLPNKKIALLDKTRMEFPVVDDLDIPGMGEIEGHYQPVLKPGVSGEIGYLKSSLIHDALLDERAWAFRHEKYARWESGMNKKCAWPCDPVLWRERIKIFLRGNYFRPEIVFILSYILSGGFLDGRAGLKLALLRCKYLRLIRSLDATG